MNEQVKEYISKYPSEMIERFQELRTLIFDSVSEEPDETLWAKIPSYYVGEAFIRLIPFKDHINVEARVLSEYQEALSDYKMTPKGMLSIFLKDEIPSEELKQVFAKTLGSENA